MTKLETHHSLVDTSKFGFGNRELVPTNLRVKGIARRFRWEPTTLIRRVENALPAPVEQQVYLEVGLGYRIQPESLAKMLKVFREADSLREIDRDWHTVGLNMVKSRFTDILDKIEAALLLIDKTSDAAEYMMSMESAAHLVEAYGEHAEDVLGQIIENLGVVQRLLCISSEVPRKIVGVAVKEIVKTLKGYPSGKPYPLTIEDMFSGVRQSEIRRIE